MPRLYLRIYFALIGSLVVFAVTAALLWHRADGPADHASESLARLVQNALPPADAPPEQQATVLTGLMRGLNADVTLYAIDRSILGSVGAPLSLPDETLENEPTGAMRASRRGKVASWSLRLPDGRWLLASAPIGPPRSIHALIQMLALLAIAVGIGAFPIVRYLTRRLERLHRAVEALGAGELSARVAVEGRDEVARLATSFNRAAQRIEQLVNAHKTLLAQASHELRTPLTRIRLAVELIKEAADPKRKAGLMTDIAELDDLVDEILLFSRLEALDELEVNEELDLLALAAEECARYDDTELAGTPVTLSGDARLLRRLLRNLLENARRHGKPPVQVALEVTRDIVELRVSDAGTPLAEDRRERLFEPFYRHADSGGAGLGLALVQRIAHRHGGEARYEILGDGPGVFVVVLPLTSRMGRTHASMTHPDRTQAAV